MLDKKYIHVIYQKAGPYCRGTGKTLLTLRTELEGRDTHSQDEGSLPTRIPPPTTKRHISYHDFKPGYAYVYLETKAPNILSGYSYNMTLEQIRTENKVFCY